MESGIDPADFSHGLCERMRVRALAAEERGEERVRPGHLLDKAYKDVSNDSSIVGGGSTACIAVGRDDGILEVAK